MSDEINDEGMETPEPDAPETPSEPDHVTVEATLLDGETDTFTVERGSTLHDLSRKLHLPEPHKRVATDEDDVIITPDFVFTDDHTNICYVVNAKGGNA
jgi:hypothetical protein